ncbi:MAG: CHAD domain-containing protein [Anaerolineae bacterium]|nr:CHAD domain-containing protein [Anaerolineae bacterium]
MEIEAKYRITSEDTFAQLQSLNTLGQYTLEAGCEVAFSDTYYDTNDRHVLSSGYALRKRLRRESTILSIKSLSPSRGNLHIREEIEAAAPVIHIDQPSTWPNAVLRDRIWSMTGGYPLIALFELQQVRITRAVTLNGKDVAELCMDKMRCQSGASEIHYSGLEVELKSTGKDSDLTRLCECLESIANLTPEVHSKFELALAFTAAPAGLLIHAVETPTPVPDIHPQDSMATAALKSMLTHFEEMKRNDAGSQRGEDIEFIHDMRVAVRRMRAALRIFATYIPEAAINMTLKTLKKTGRVLGVVRDMDVFRLNYELYAITNQVETRHSSLTVAWNAAYNQARSQLLRTLTGNRYQTFRSSFAETMHNVLSSAGAAPPVQKQIWVTIDQQQQNVFAHYNLLQKRYPVSLYDYHQLRISLKYLRYCLEYFQLILDESGQAYIAQMKILQDHLGMLQDAVVARQKIRTVLHWGMWNTPNQPYTLMAAAHQPSPDAIAYLDYTQNEIDQLIRDFPNAWQQFRDFIAHDPFKNIRNTL